MALCESDVSQDRIFFLVLQKSVVHNENKTTSVDYVNSMYIVFYESF